MQFTSLPTPFASIGEPLLYTLADLRGASVDVRILIADEQLLGTKRLVGATTCTLDIAPYLRNAATIKPPSPDTPTGFVALDDRWLDIVVEVDDGECILRSDPRSFFVACQPITTPSLCTALPRERLLAPSECDLLTLRMTEPTIVVTEIRPDGTTYEHRFTVHIAPLCGFWVRADDFPEAERLVVALGQSGSVAYSLLPHPEGAVRLAWRSESGALEHYTFPRKKHHRVAVQKQRGYGEAGYRTLTSEVKERMTLESAYESETMLRALAEVLYAEQVWRSRPTGYEAVDVLTEQAETSHHGALGTLEIEIRNTLKNKSLWN